MEFSGDAFTYGHMYIRTNTAFPRINLQWQSVEKIPYKTQNGGLVAIFMHRQGELKA